MVPPLLQPNIPRGIERGGHWAFSRCAEVGAELELLLLRSSWMPRVHAHAYASHLMLSGVVHAERGTRALCNVCSHVGAHAGLRQRPPSFAGLVPTYKERCVGGGSILINKVKMLLVVDARTGKPGQTKLRLPPTLALPLIGGTNPTPGLYCARRRVPLGSPSHFLLHMALHERRREVNPVPTLAHTTAWPMARGSAGSRRPAAVSRAS